MTWALAAARNQRHVVVFLNDNHLLAILGGTRNRNGSKTRTATAREARFGRARRRAEPGTTLSSSFTSSSFFSPPLLPLLLHCGHEGGRKSAVGKRCSRLLRYYLDRSTRRDVLAGATLRVTAAVPLFTSRHARGGAGRGVPRDGPPVLGVLALLRTTLGNFTMMLSLSTRRTPQRAAGNSTGTDGDGGAGHDDGAGIDGDGVRAAGEGTGETRTGDGATPALTARRDAAGTAGPEEDDGAAA